MSYVRETSEELTYSLQSLIVGVVEEELGERLVWAEDVDLGELVKMVKEIKKENMELRKELEKLKKKA